MRDHHQDAMAAEREPLEIPKAQRALEEAISAYREIVKQYHAKAPVEDPLAQYGAPPLNRAVSHEEIFHRLDSLRGAAGALMQAINNEPDPPSEAELRTGQEPPEPLWSRGIFEPRPGDRKDFSA